ncbi:hypothetical protein BV898_05264 [Hypsibius exemplaris]|uniref:Uncharacterized protein n=1 Tax=Hypsibius exemplaris TaxID=2072580 RepID=A0A1W0WZN9_HYPEX|nr:hypothetical protein BV898_05264 [Hypsibius exemplaris]
MLEFLALSCFLTPAIAQFNSPYGSNQGGSYTNGQYQSYSSPSSTGNAQSSYYLSPQSSSSNGQYQQGSSSFSNGQPLSQLYGTYDGTYAGRQATDFAQTNLGSSSTYYNGLQMPTSSYGSLSNSPYVDGSASSGSSSGIYNSNSRQTYASPGYNTNTFRMRNAGRTAKSPISWLLLWSVVCIALVLM